MPDLQAQDAIISTRISSGERGFEQLVNSVTIAQAELALSTHVWAVGTYRL